MEKKNLVITILAVTLLIVVLAAAINDRMHPRQSVTLTCNQYTLHALNLSECFATFEYGGRNITYRGTYDLSVRE